MTLSKSVLGAAIAAALMSSPALAGVAVQPWSSAWNEGAPDCTKVKAPPPIEVHAYDAHTFVLRENLCSTWEAPFLYLLVGRDRPLLIDTGDVADPSLMPLAKTVSALIAQAGATTLPLLVVHTHRHLDHRAGDPQFLGRANTVVVGYDIDSVKDFYRFTHWPDGVAHIDLGGRTVDVVPSPGHNETHLVFYDRNTTILFSGDFMMPGRLLIDDPAAEIASAHRVADFVRNKPVAAALGGHIEFDRDGKTLPWQGTYHPSEHTLAMTKADLLALPAIAESFNGFYSEAGGFILMDSIRILIALAVAAVAVLVGLIVGIVLFIRRRRRVRG
jgi:glyoxylase-like metal-dependent hydrolase (beta-lactamase superfamily II)